jgi:hypothetical protein
MPISKNVGYIREPFNIPTIGKIQRKEALRIIEVALSINDVGDNMKSKVIDLMIWNYAGAIKGAYGKYRGKYCSIKSMENEDAELIHEHVFERKQIIKKILQEGKITEKIKNIMVTCVVTKEEDNELKSLAKNKLGWDRYKAANIKVIDMENNVEYI